MYKMYQKIKEALMDYNCDAFKTVTKFPAIID